MLQGPGGSGVAGWRWLGTINGREMGSVMENYCIIKGTNPLFNGHLGTTRIIGICRVLSSSQPRPALGGADLRCPLSRVEGGAVNYETKTNGSVLLSIAISEIVF